MLMGDTPWMETWARAAEQSSEVVRIGFRPRDDDGPWLRRELGESVHYTIKVPPRTGPYRVVGRASDASLVLRFVRALREIERRHGRVDLLHAHFYANARWLPDMQRLVERPFVVTEHSTGWSGENPDNQISPRGRKIATRTYRHAAAVIAVSENLRSMMVAAGVPDDNLVVVPNPVDTTIFRPAAPCPPHEPRRLIAVSRLAEVKNFPVLFAALRQLVDAGVPFTIDVVGDGPARATVERDVASLPFGAARLLGSLPQEEVADHLRGADLFVTATRAENLPVAIIEALATGLPVVATDVNGVRELIDTDELGTLVPRDDPSALADAIRRAVGTTDDPTRRAARAQLAASRYSVQAVGIALATLYGTLRTPTDATTSASDAVRRHRETDPRAGRG
jgi:glycosyltransferase involved in cell wall biosynthesis